VGIDTRHGDGGDGEVFRHASRMVDEARAFGSAMSGKASSLTESLDLGGRMQRHPFAMVLGALGLGYLLGGGLFSPLTGRLLRVGAKVALIPLIKSQLSALAASATPFPEHAED
jgi:hypothetical protein